MKDCLRYICALGFGIDLFMVGVGHDLMGGHSVL